MQIATRPTPATASTQRPKQAVPGVGLGIDNDIERAGLRFKMVSKFNSYNNYVVLALTIHKTIENRNKYSNMQYADTL